jgi:hypothetical protein
LDNFADAGRLLDRNGLTLLVAQCRSTGLTRVGYRSFGRLPGGRAQRALAGTRSPPARRAAVEPGVLAIG